VRLPRTVHHFWGGSPLPDHLAAYVDSWREHHPPARWHHRMWSDDDLHWIPNRDLYDAAAEFVPRDAVWQFRADIARYAILLEFGGLWVDCDAEALAPIDDVLAGHDAFAAAEDATWVGNTIIGCTPGHPVMAAIVAGLRQNVLRKAPSRPTRLTGPQYISAYWRAHGCHVAPTRLFYPYSYRDVQRGTAPTDYGQALVAHHWQHTRDLMVERGGRRVPASRR
jgi:mannosyltransferase OCH1-like enzyme